MKMRNAKGRSQGSGYGRLFNDAALGELFSKAQATVISNGSELERILLEKTQNILDLEHFISEIEEGASQVYPEGIYLCTKKALKKSRYAIEGIEPDLMIFLVQKKRVCKIIELKDGDTFDTKKSAAEQEHLERFSKEFGCQVPFSTEYYICSFNQLDKEVIYTGFKKSFQMEHIMTGKELCDLLGLDYDAIIRTRLEDAEDNLRFFAEELVKIPAMREALREALEKV